MSCEYSFQLNESSIELVITVEYNSSFIEQKVNTLWVYQIHRLFETYIDEQINLSILMAQEPSGCGGLIMERNLKLKQYKRKMLQYQSHRDTIQFIKSLNLD